MRVTSHLTNGFRVHPNYGNDLRKQYNQILFEIAQSTLLQSMVDQITAPTGRSITVEKEGMDPTDILQADYALS